MKNRWLIVLSAIGIHICIGSVYAWSVLTRPIMKHMGITLEQATWCFSLAILFLGLSAAFLGTYVERMGPRKSGLLSAAFFGSGLLCTAAAIYSRQLYLLYISYGVIVGVGLGVGYITPVSTLVKWFPYNRGLATGLAIMGFGFASLIAGPLMQYLVTSFGLVWNFVFLGIGYAAVIAASALYMAPPEVKLVKTTMHVKPEEDAAVSCTVHEAMRTWKFYALWTVFFINITCGIGLLAVASPMAQDLVKMTAVQAASMVGIVGLLNGIGRIVWSTVSDYIGRNTGYLLFCALQVAAFNILVNVESPLVFQIMVFVIVTCYGGGFACMPAYLSDIFGTKQLSAIHGRILSAWGFAGIAGPIVISRFVATTGSYGAAMNFFAACCAVNFVIVLLLRIKK